VTLTSEVRRPTLTDPCRSRLLVLEAIERLARTLYVAEDKA
jgi:hypothetical protein